MHAFDRRTDGQTDRRTDGRTDGQTPFSSALAFRAERKKMRRGACGWKPVALSPGHSRQAEPL